MKDLFGIVPKIVEEKPCEECGHREDQHVRKYGCMVTYKSGMENCDCMAFKRPLKE